MSTNSECTFIEVLPSEWYYLLENSNAPKNAWDWREHATCYGPFLTEGGAKSHLDRNHANPGSWEVNPYSKGYKPDEIMQKHIHEAKQRGTRSRAQSYGYRF